MPAEATNARDDARAWQQRLERADTRESVLAVTRDFLALVSMAELSEVPQGSMPGLLDNADHIEYYAVKLAHAYLNHTAEEKPGLHRLSAFFTKAALRLMQIEGRLENEAVA